MTPDPSEVVSQAVLYEGYLLYPYYPESTKNRHRFQFGGLYPPAYVEANPGADRCAIRTEFLARAPDEAVLRIGLRGLHLTGEDPARDETAERRIELAPIRFAQLGREASVTTSSFPAAAGAELRLRVEAEADRLGEGLWRIRIAAANETVRGETERALILGSTLFSAHFFCVAEGGELVSQIDPPAELATEAGRNRQEGVYPVLVGDEAKHDRLLAASIILYDFPRIAPESRGDLFDGLEIDEILSLRIRTLTDDEKVAVRAAGPRAAALLERTEALSDEELLGLHGVCRAPRISLEPGERVRLHPKGSDALDVVFRGRIAVVEKVEHTLEDDCLVAVTIEDDPGRDLGMQGLPGHRFFFRPDELERIV